MTYEEFKGELYRIIMQQEPAKGRRILFLERGYTSGDAQTIRLIRQINRATTGWEDSVIRGDCLEVIWGEGNLRSMMGWDVHQLFERYKREGWHGLIPDLLCRIQKSELSAQWLKLAEEDYEKIREKLLVRPINLTENEAELDNCIYRVCGDMALTLYGLVYDDAEDLVTMKVKREMTCGWDLSDEKLLQDALKNTMRMMPPRLFYCTDTRARHSEGEGVFMREETGSFSVLQGGIGIRIDLESELEGCFGYRLTTRKGVNGAIAAFYPGVQERLSELMGGDFLMGFTSIHEAVVHPANRQKANNMRESIRRINHSFPREEVLSYKVFRYHTARRELIEV